MTTDMNQIEIALAEADELRRLLVEEPGVASKLNALTESLLHACEGSPPVHTVPSLIAALLTVTTHLQGDRVVFVGALMTGLLRQHARFVSPGNDQVH